jgi:hypothetical protein
MMDSQHYISQNWQDYRIVNASAIQYDDVWPAQCECGLPKMTYHPTSHKLTFEYDNLTSTDDNDVIADRSYNPYRYNVLGNWRPVKSYAYLTGRNSTGDTPRKNGFYNTFKPFYKLDGTKWVVDQNNILDWTFASEISRYNSYGQEVENRDALSRHSSAYYGYNNRFPVAVAANTKYSELAYDGFEDYAFSDCSTNTHFNFQQALTAHSITVSDKEAHTGRRSIRLEPGAGSATIKKRVSICVNATVLGAKVKSVTDVKAAPKAILGVNKQVVTPKKQAVIKSVQAKPKLKPVTPKATVKSQTAKPAAAKVTSKANKIIKK